MTFREFSLFLIEINRFSAIPGIMVFLLLIRKPASRFTKLVFFILLASFCTDIISYFSIRYIYPNSWLIINAWYLINFFLVSSLYFTLTRYKKLIVFLLVIFSIGAIISYGWYFSFLEANTFVKSLTSISFTLVPIIIYYELLRESPVDSLQHYPVFWINTGIFLYSSIHILRSVFDHYLIFDLKVSPELFSYLSSFNLLINILKNLMFFYALLLIRRGRYTRIYDY